jgi:hypothetical protein
LLGGGVCWGPGSGSVVDSDIEMAARCLRRHQRVLKGAAGRGQRERRRRNEDWTGERAWVGCAQGAGGSGTGAGRRNWGHASPDRPTRATQATKQRGDPSGPGDDPSHVRVAEVHPGHCRSTRIPSYPQTKHVLCCAWSKTPSLLARPQHLRPSSCVASRLLLRLASTPVLGLGCELSVTSGLCRVQRARMTMTCRSLRPLPSAHHSHIFLPTHKRT